MVDHYPLFEFASSNYLWHQTHEKRFLPTTESPPRHQHLWCFHYLSFKLIGLANLIATAIYTYHYHPIPPHTEWQCSQQDTIIRQAHQETTSTQESPYPQ